MVRLGELVMIMELHRQGLSPMAIARQLGLDRKTVCKYIALGLEPPRYGPRKPRPKSTDPFLPYLRERLAAYPGLTAVRLGRELRERGHAGSYTAVKRAVQSLRPDPVQPFEVRFETPPGAQAQVDLARFEVSFTDEPGSRHIVWLFSMVLGYSRLIWARYVVHQDLGTVLRCHVAAFEALGGAPGEILYWVLRRKCSPTKKGFTNEESRHQLSGHLVVSHGHPVSTPSRPCGRPPRLVRQPRCAGSRSNTRGDDPRRS